MVKAEVEVRVVEQAGVGEEVVGTSPIQVPVGIASVQSAVTRNHISLVNAVLTRYVRNVEPR